MYLRTTLLYCVGASSVAIGVAKGGGAQGARAPPIKIPLTTKSYDNIAWRCLVAVFFSVITHITVINNNINDNK